MHSLLDRGTILAGLVDELRPLLPPLGGALGDLCAGVGQAEAAEQALETAFMIRAAAEMLELTALSEAATMVEEVVPLLNGAPSNVLRDGLPVVQGLLAAVEQETEALTTGGGEAHDALRNARTGLERLREGRGEVGSGRPPTVLDLEEMLATLPTPGTAEPDALDSFSESNDDRAEATNDHAEAINGHAALETEIVDSVFEASDPVQAEAQEVAAQEAFDTDHAKAYGDAIVDEAPQPSVEPVAEAELAPESEEFPAERVDPPDAQAFEQVDASARFEAPTPEQPGGMFSRFMRNLRGQSETPAGNGYARPQPMEIVDYPPTIRETPETPHPIVPAAAELQDQPEIDPEILEVFSIEAHEIMGLMEQHLRGVQADRNDREAAIELRRACHTLKGAANVVGFPTIGLVSKAMEDLLDAVADAGLAPDDAVVTFLHTAFESIRVLIAHPGDPELLSPSEMLAERGAQLAMNVGVAPEQSFPTEGADDGTWARAVDDFLADTPAEATEGPLAADLREQYDDAPSDSQPVAEADHVGPGEAEEEALDAELVTIFAAEAEDHLASISGAALSLDVNPNDEEALNEARRALHTLKGAAGALGLEALSGFCHETESRLESESPTAAARLLFEAAEILEQAIRGLATTGRVEITALPETMSLPEATSLPLEESSAEEPSPQEPAPVAPPTGTSESADVLGRGTSPRATEHVDDDEGPVSGSVRVELGRVDELLNVVGEVVLTRSSLEQRLERVNRSAEELKLTVARLRRVAQFLEDRYEVAELIRTAPSEAGHGDFDELEMDRYTELHRISREMTELAADTETTTDELELALKELDTLAERQARLGSDLQDKLMAIRLVPLSSIGTRLHRTARSVALKQEKQLEFVIQGGETELDKRVLEELGDVLLHLIRNAVDHGIEPPNQREQLGKPATGTLSLRAFREGSEAVIQLSDDGRGVDLRRLRQRAEMLGVIRAAEDLDEHELIELMFQPGISTSSVTSEVSGRGVGLDAVRAAVARLKGSIEVSSAAGEGTTFTLRLPVVLAVLQAMLVRAGDQTYAVPMAALEQVIRTTAQPSANIGRTSMIELEGEVFAFLDLGPALGEPPTLKPGVETPMLVIKTGERRVALAVGELLGQQEIVVKSLGPHLRSVPGVLGGTIQGNGQVLLVLNTAELLTARALMLGGSPGRPFRTEELKESGLNALIVDDSLSVRKVLARALERDGWEVHQARDGVNALEVLQKVRPSVVLMDIEMPRMDGFELAGILRDVQDYGNPPVVMITSRAGEKHRKRAEELGVAGYLVKPYQETELIATLRQVAAGGIRS